MPRRLLLEGSDPAALLAQVWEEHGTAGRVVHAERRRQGGLLGLFARESYVLTVEVPDRAGSLAPLRPAAAPDGGDEADAALAAELEDVEAVSRDLLAYAPSAGRFEDVLDSVVRAADDAPAVAEPVRPARAFVPASFPRVADQHETRVPRTARSGAVRPVEWPRTR